MNLQSRRASKWYRWLWLSPLLTIPTALAVAVFVLVFFWSSYYRYSNLVVFFALLVPALWHLILLIPAFGSQDEFVRWHGRQALLLAGLRTVIPVIFLASLMFGGGLATLGALAAVIAQISVWAVGTASGQGQAARGECSLMRWAGHADALPHPVPWPALEPEPVPGPLENGEALAETISRIRDPQRRREMVDQLERRGLIEPL